MLLEQWGVAVFWLHDDKEMPEWSNHRESSTGMFE